MAKRPDVSPSYRELIHAAYSAAEMSVDRLYKRYLLLGGEIGSAGFRSWMKGESEPQATDFARVCRILNQRLMELDKHPMLPDIPLPQRPPGDDGVDSAPPLTDMGGYPSTRTNPRVVDLAEVDAA